MSKVFAHEQLAMQLVGDQHAGYVDSVMLLCDVMRVLGFRGKPCTLNLLTQLIYQVRCVA
jgi:hypothetical protein